MNTEDKQIDSQIHSFIELLQLSDKIRHGNYTNEDITRYTELYNKYYGIETKTSGGLGK